MRLMSSMTLEDNKRMNGLLGWLPESPFEVRLAVVLFLALMGLAEVFGAWQVKNFAAFSPTGIASTVAPGGPPADAPGDASAGETPVSLQELNTPARHIERDLLVQDTHVHVPAYALTAAALSLIVLGLRLGSGWRTALIAGAFFAPLADFAGLWGAHLVPSAGTAFGALAAFGGFGMGLVYTVIAVLAVSQCWRRKPREERA